MRRLVSKEEEEKKRKRNQTILVVFLALIMVLSTIGFAIQGNSDSSTGANENEIEYNGYKFINQNGLWVLDNENFINFVFRYTPREVPDMGFGIKPVGNYQGKPAYVYSEDSEAEIEIAVNLGPVAQRIQKNFTES